MSDVSVALSALDQAGVLLKDYGGQSGGVLLSGLDTLAPGAYYVMGYNPGGDEKSDHSLDSATIGASLAASRTRMGWNEWADPTPEDWRYEAYKSKAQSAFRALGTDPKRTFSTNALFVRSPSVKDLPKTCDPWELWWDVCWPVHRLFLSIIRPKVVVCLGCGPKSAWEFLRQPSGQGRRTTVWHWMPAQDETAGEGKWRSDVVLRLEGADTHSCAVLGLPHPSSRNGYWTRAGDGWALSPAAMAKVALARRIAGLGD